MHGCAGLCGCALCEGVGDFVVVLTATCNSAFPLFLTTPFKPFECSASIRNKSLFIMSCFLLRGTMCYCSPTTYYLLYVECFVCCDGPHIGRWESGSQASWANLLYLL